MTWKVPALADLAPSIEPTEYCVLLAMSEKQTKTAGGILLAAETLEKAEFGSDHGRLVAVSPLAFSYAKPEDWSESRKPQVGDVVFVGKYAGTEIEGRDGKKYRLANDRDIKAVIERAEDALADQIQRALSAPVRQLEQAHG